MSNDEAWDKKTIALAAFILFGSGSGIGNLLVPNIRSGAFTEGDFQKEKALLVAEIEELRDGMTLLELQSSQIMDDDMECHRRQNTVEKELKWLREKVTTYQAETKRWDAHQDKLIQDCMSRL